MRRSFILSLLLLLAFPAVLWAERIDMDRAMEIARNHRVFQSFSGPRTRGSGPVLIHSLGGPRTRGGADYRDLYVFGRESGPGFVLVSGDDTLPLVLGFSETGRFSDEVPALRPLLEEYASWAVEARKQATRHGLAPRTRGSGLKELPSYPSSVEPILVKDGVPIQWNQMEPYNRLTPEIEGKQSPTGCVATAVAQVLYFFSSAEVKPDGAAVTFGRAGKAVSVNLSTEPFDWEKMTPTYGKSSSDEACKAVAYLMQQVGYASSMNYDEESSGAMEYDALSGTVLHMGMDPSATLVYRKELGAEPFAQVLRAELEKGFPLVVTAYAAEGGHAFCVDGYEQSGLVHVNWGWGGVADGYFALNNMEPSSQGTGSGGPGGYLRSMSFLKNFFPRTPGAPSVGPSYSRYQQLRVDDPKNQKDEMVQEFLCGEDLEARVFFFSNLCNGELALALLDDQGTVVMLVSEPIPMPEKSMSSYSEGDVGTELTMKTQNLPLGDYQLSPVFRPEGGTEWTASSSPYKWAKRIRVMGDPSKQRTAEGAKSYKFELYGYYAGTQLRFELISTVPSPVIKGGFLDRVYVRVTNESDQTYESAIAAISSSNVPQYFTAKEHGLRFAYLAPGDQTVLEIEVGRKASAKSIPIRVYYDPNNSFEALKYDFSGLALPACEKIEIIPEEKAMKKPAVIKATLGYHSEKIDPVKEAAVFEWEFKNTSSEEAVIFVQPRFDHDELREVDFFEERSFTIPAGGTVTDRWTCGLHYISDPYSALPPIDPYFFEPLGGTAWTKLEGATFSYQMEKKSALTPGASINVYELTCPQKVMQQHSLQLRALIENPSQEKQFDGDILLLASRDGKDTVWGRYKGVHFSPYEKILLPMRKTNMLGIAPGVYTLRLVDGDKQPFSGDASCQVEVLGIPRLKFEQASSVTAFYGEERFTGFTMDIRCINESDYILTEQIALVVEAVDATEYFVCDRAVMVLPHDTVVQTLSVLSLTEAGDYDLRIVRREEGVLHFDDPLYACTMHMPTSAREGGQPEGDNVHPSVGVEASDLLRLSVAPNPAATFVRIEGLQFEAPYAIFDLMGRRVQAGRIAPGGVIDVQQLRSGIHLLRVGHIALRFLRQ